MSESLKVLMMGGPRSGKTSALAGLVDTMLNGEVRKILSVKDVTEGNAIKQKLAQKVESLKLTLIQSYGKTIIVDDSKTEAFQDYVVEFAIPGTSQNMQICFTDANGEFFETGRAHDSTICEMVQKYDVFLIAIDTPSLMEAANKSNTLMNEAINKAVNNVSDMHNFMTYLDDKDGHDAKMVIFVPLKCEKWAHEDRLEKVSERVKEVYAVQIEAMSKMKNVEVDILPVQTVGNIVFSEHMKSYICLTEGDSPQICSFVNEKSSIRFADGHERPVNRSSDKFADDLTSIVREGTSIRRPVSWFKVIRKEYSPHNCEQLAYYILQFLLAKYLYVKEQSSLLKRFKLDTEGIFRFILNPPFYDLRLFLRYLLNLLVNYLGTMSSGNLQRVLDSIKERKLIKTSGEGICRIKKSLLDI